MQRFEKKIATPVGEVTLISNGAVLNALRFGDVLTGKESCLLLEQAAKELNEYFAGERHVFSIPLEASGTEFQCSVWDSLLTIPYGETASYAEIAAKIGKPNACRAVGGANNRNPLPIFIPCHRVVGKNGKLVGYAGGLDTKEYLLRLERE